MQVNRCDRTNRWTGATGSVFRIKRDPAKVLGSPWPGQLKRCAASNFMKPIVALIVVGFIASCSTTRTQFPTPLSISAPSPSIDEGLSPPSYEQMLPQVARLAKEAGIPNLKDANLSDAQTELRLWMGLGLITPRCFMLKIDNGNPTSSFATVKIVRNKGVFLNGNPVYVNAPLNAPHSGWPTFLAFLRQNGIDTSINLALDKHYEPDPDQEFLILEMKTGSRHTLVHYLDSTVTADGKKAFAVCEKIQNEFDIRLGCKL